MSQIRNIVISIIALIVLFFIMQRALEGAPPIFILFPAIIGLIIVWNVARRLIKGY